MSYPIPEIIAPRGSIIDTHAHYASDQYDGILDEIFASFEDLGVSSVINCGCTIESSKKNIEFAKKYDCCYAAVGFHPQDITKEPLDFDTLENLLKREKVVALGEIGLDYYWNKENREKQIEAFIFQIELAKKYDLPIIVHDRDAHADTLEILKKYKPKGVVHCFSGSVETAREIIALGMMISFTGVLTFKNSRKAVEACKEIPMERLMLETDSPYMAPVPHRGKRNNSSYTYHVAEKVAEIKNLPVEDVIKICNSNADTFFGIE